MKPIGNPWNRDWIWGLLLLAVTLLAYSPALTGGPVWDDNVHMTNPQQRSAVGLMRIWTQPRTIPQYYPLVHTVFWLEYRLFGDATLGYHTLNILLHFFSALLLVLILRRLGIPGAWFAGGIFALHPVMVESVAWITELKNTLSCVFFLGAAIAYLRFDYNRRKKQYVVALMLFSVGLFAKSVIVTLPAALLVVLWWKRGELGWKHDVAPLLPFFVIGIISGLLTTWFERSVVGAEGAGFDLAFIDRCLVAGKAVWFYLYKIFWPVDLIFIYPRWRIDATAAWQYLFHFAFVLALAWGLRRYTRAPLAALLYFSITVFPALGFFNLFFFRYSFVADHFQYLASMGPITVVAASLTRGTGLLTQGLRQKAQTLLFGLALSALFMLTWKQSSMYYDAETLYRTTIRKNRDCWMAHYNLGCLLENMGRTDEARAQYDTTLALNPNHDRAHINFGILLAKMGRADEAIAHYQKALEINPKSDEAHYNLGFVFAAMGRTNEAIAHYREALEINHSSAEAHYNLGNLLADMGQGSEAEAHFRAALEIHPNDNEIHNNFGLLLANMGRTEEALAHFRKALEINPNHAEAHNNLGILFAKMRRTDEALDHFRKALEINPAYAQAHNNLGIVLMTMGQIDEAIVQYRKALEINPAEMSALKHLAFALAQKGQLADATSLLQNAHASATSAGDEARATMIELLLTKLREPIKFSK